MSVQRFSLYFLAVMACAVVAFPRLAPARSAAAAPDSVAAARRATGRRVAPRHLFLLRHRAFEPPRLVASR